MKFQAPLRIGTRKSALAMIQTEMVVAALKAAHSELCSDGAIEIVGLETYGDKTQKDNLSLVEHGGKALWASEHEQAMRDGIIDCAVHSTKDIPGILDDDMVMPCFLPRADARDVFLSSTVGHFTALPEGATIGTSSPRRAAIVLAKRPDLNIVTFRGNIGTRLKKIAHAEVDGTFLAAAGMIRGGYKDMMQTILEPSEMLPAVGQGAIGIEFKKDRDDLHDLFSEIHDLQTGICVKAERAWLAGMGGSCRSPLAAYAELNGDQLRLRAFASDFEGTDVKTCDITASVQDEIQAQKMGADLAAEMLKGLPKGFV